MLVKEGYIIPAAMQKLRVAKAMAQPVYICAITGYGKTELVRQYLAHRRYTYLSCAGELWRAESLPPKPAGWKKQDTKSVVVIDDLHCLREEGKQKEIVALLKREDIWLILISRGQVPPWLRPEYVKTGFATIVEDDLRLNGKEIADFLSHYGVGLDEASLATLEKNSRGNPYVLTLAAKCIQSEGLQPGPALYKRIRDLFADYLENAVFLQMEPEMLDFLMQVSIVDEFDVPLAEMITGNAHVAGLLYTASYIGDFLREQGERYRMPPAFVDILRGRAERVFGRARLRECFYNAGLYYEMHDKIPEALSMYEKSGWDSRIRELLIRNARRNPGSGHYFELRRYYLRLKDDEIEGNVILMAGMSMLYSMLMQPEKSEYWYGRLKACAASARGGEKKEAQSRLSYLDIALPHRGSSGMLHILKQIPALLLDRGVGLPEFSVTSNLPSIMNGGKDFCHWSKYDRELAASVGLLLQRVLGRYGKGLLNVALGESLYEKGGDTYEVLTLLSRGEMETMGGGMLEMAFAAVGVRSRLHLVNGDLETAKLQVESFEARCREERAAQLLPNIRALRCRLALYEGDKDAADRWLAQAPDENQEFCGMERYRYLCKVRCYLAQGEELKAMALLEKLRYYAEQCKRPYIAMEVGLLTAIARSRRGEPWQDGFVATLRELERYRFVRLISEEGPAVSALLRQAKAEGRLAADFDAAWLETVMRETKEMALRCPVYLKRRRLSAQDFSPHALAVLRLQAEGLSATQIAAQLGLKPENVRYHTKENYRKLEVTGKTDAVLAARNLHLI